MIYLLDYGMGLANLCFLIAIWFVRQPNQRKKSEIETHKKLAQIGVAITIIIGLTLIVYSRVMNHGLADPSLKMVTWAQSWMFWLHRLVAVFTFILMILLAYWGYNKKLKWHRRLGRPFVVLYTLVYLSGIFLFKG